MTKMMLGHRSDLNFLPVSVFSISFTFGKGLL